MGRARQFEPGDQQPGGCDRAGRHGNHSGAAEATLSLSKDVADADDEGMGSVIAGEYETYTFTVSNTEGPADAADVVVTDTLPEGMTFRNAAGADCSAEGQTVTCDVGTVPYGESVEFRASFNVASSVPEGTELENSAIVGYENDDEADSDTATTVVTTQADVTVNSIEPNYLHAGGDATYHAQVRNAGPSDAQNVQITYTIPEGDENMTFSDLQRQGCDVSEDGRTITCTIENLPAGSSVSFPIRVSLTPDTPVGYTPGMTGSVTSDTPFGVTEDGEPITERGIDIDHSGTSVQVTSDVAVEKRVAADDAVDSPTYRAGQTFTYEIEVWNAGPANAAEVELVDELPSGMRVDPDGTLPEGCEASGGSEAGYGATITCDLGTMAPGGGTDETERENSQVISVPVQIDPAKQDDGANVRNTATVSTTTDESRYLNNSNSAPIPGGQLLAPQADLTLGKSVAQDRIDGPVTPGETFWYRLDVANDGPSAAMNPRVVDTLPPGVTYVGVESDNDWHGYVSGNTVSFNYSGAYGPGESDALYVEVRLDPAYTGDGSDLVNVATVASDTERPDGLPEAPSSEAVGVGEDGVGSPQAALQINKSMHAIDGQETVVPGGLAELSFTVENRGPSTATGLSITDSLPAGLAFHAGAGCEGPVGEYGGTVTCDNLGSLGVGGELEFQFLVRIDPNWDPESDDPIENVASATAFPGTEHEVTVNSDDPIVTTDPETGETVENPRDPATFNPDIIRTPEADLELDKSLDLDGVEDGEIAPGDEFDFQITVTNHGPSTGRGITVTDELPEGLSFVSASDGGTESGGEVAWDLENLPVGESTTLTLTVQLSPDYEGDGSDVVNTATVSSTNDPNEDNDTDEASVAAGQPHADVAVEKTALGTDAVTPGEEFVYEVQVTNNGPSTAHSVSIVDTLPDELGYVSSDECQGGDQRYGGTVTCPTIESLSPGSTVTHEITVVLDPNYQGDGSDIENRVEVSTRTPDLNSANNVATAGLPADGTTATRGRAC